MPYRYPDGTTNVGLVPFVVGEVRYFPENVSQAERAALGLREVVEAPYDAEHYAPAAWTEAEDGLALLRTPELAPRFTVDELRARKAAAVKAEAGRLLAPTDWCVVRLAETGAPIPAVVLAYRASVRDMSNTLEAEINALADYADLAAYSWAGRWPEIAEG